MHSDPEFDDAVAEAGLTLHRHPLGWYVEKLSRAEPYSLIRWGDGELYCMQQRQGYNTSGTPYTPSLGAALRKTAAVEQPGLYHGLQRVLPQDVAALGGFRPGVEWVDSEVFCRALAAGELYPFVEQLRRMNTVIVGNQAVCVEASALLRGTKYHIVDPRRADMDIDWVVRAIQHRQVQGVYLFSCGMAANVMVGKLHSTVPGSWFLDVGHIWDAFAGLASREYLATLPAEVLAKNLGR